MSGLFKSQGLLSVSMVVALTAVCWCGVEAAQPSASEGLIAFIYRIALYTRWEIEETEPVDICVLSKKGRFWKALGHLSSKEIHGHSIRHYVHKQIGPALSSCEILLVDESTTHLTPKLSKLPFDSVLFIGLEKGVLGNGGAVYLDTSGEKLAFEVDRRALAEANVSLSARVLSLAREVRN